MSIVTANQIGERGQMGNQLFQIATVLGVAKKNGIQPVFPEKIRELSLNKVFDLRIETKDFPVDVTIPERDNYEDIQIPADGRVYSISGYRQSYLYFNNIDLSKYIQIHPYHLSLPKKYIGIHIRRGDYVNSSWIRQLSQMVDIPTRCELQYYQQAIKRIHTEYGKIPVIICTDDRKWAQEHLQEIDSTAILNPDPNLDFQCLYQAPYLIIPNSTFSWWAGYLGQHKVVISPSYWWHPNGILSRMFGLNQQLICPSSWIFLHPVTGEITESFNWTPQESQWPHWLRGFFTS